MPGVIRRGSKAPLNLTPHEGITLRVIAGDRGLKEVDGLSGRRYKVAPDGSFNMSPRDAKAAIAGDWAFTPSMMSGLRDPNGYVCPCGFAPYFSPCSRCGLPFGEAA